MAKLKVFVCSFKVPTVGFVDKEGAMHACARAQKTAFEGLAQVSSILGNRYLCDEDAEALERVKKFCNNNNGLEFEVVDVGAMNFLQKLRLRLRGIKCPAVSYGNKIFLGVPNEENLRMLLEEQNQKS
jgi:hypothetical protein